MSDPERDPIEQAVELLLYAPVGLLYEYQSVLPQLIKRGKSQVQLARVIGKLALDSQTGGVDESIEKLIGTFAVTTAQALTELGQAIGLAPSIDNHTAAKDSEPTSATPEPSTANPTATSAAASAKAPGVDGATAQPKRLPIARYDELKAKEIIALLDDLKPAQRARIGEHERANRSRKTILAKIERLAG